MRMRGCGAGARERAVQPRQHRSRTQQRLFFEWLGRRSWATDACVACVACVLLLRRTCEFLDPRGSWSVNRRLRTCWRRMGGPGRALRRPSQAIACCIAAMQVVSRGWEHDCASERPSGTGRCAGRWTPQCLAQSPSAGAKGGFRRHGRMDGRRPREQRVPRVRGIERGSEQRGDE